MEILCVIRTRAIAEALTPANITIGTEFNSLSGFVYT